MRNFDYQVIYLANRSGRNVCESVAASLLELRIRILPDVWMSFCLSVLLDVCYFLKVFDYHFCRAFAIVLWFTGIILVHQASSFSQFDHGPLPGGIQNSCYTWSLQGLFTTTAKMYSCSFRSSPGVTTRSVLCIYVYSRMCEIRLTWMTM